MKWFFVLLDTHPPLWIRAHDPLRASQAALDHVAALGHPAKVQHVLEEAEKDNRHER